MTDTFWGLLIPFLGTSLGAACVFFMQGKMNRGVERGLTGFASGVMVAASPPFFRRWYSRIAAFPFRGRCPEGADRVTMA